MPKIFLKKKKLTKSSLLKMDACAASTTDCYEVFSGSSVATSLSMVRLRMFFQNFMNSDRLEGDSTKSVIGVSRKRPLAFG